MKEAIWRLEGKFIASDCPIDHPFFRQTMQRVSGDGWRAELGGSGRGRAIASHRTRASERAGSSSSRQMCPPFLSLSPLILTPPQSFRNFVAVRIDGVRSAEFALGRGRTTELQRLNCQTHPEGPRAGGRAAGRGVGACHSTSRPPQRPPAPFHPRSLRPSISRNPSARPPLPALLHYIRNLVINGMRCSLPRFLGAIHPESEGEIFSENIYSLD